jgi:hypothetical protein
MSMAEGTPWWQMTKTPWQGLLFAGIYLFLGLGQLLNGLTPSVSVWHLVLGAFGLALSIALLAGTVALYRRERAAAEAMSRALSGGSQGG